MTADDGAHRFRAERALAFRAERTLKQDLLGRVERGRTADGIAVRRDPDAAPRLLRPLARWLARRERRVLGDLAPAGLDGVPRLVASDGARLLRTWLDGAPMHVAEPADPSFYRAARRALVRLHRAGVTHNDLAKEANWIVRPDGSPALVDFQLATRFTARGRLFRLCAREDLRHLLKHKHHYGVPLTAAERALLARPSLASVWLRRLVKPVYNTITRRWLGWSDREGQGRRARARRRA